MQKNLKCNPEKERGDLDFFRPQSALKNIRLDLNLVRVEIK